MHLAAEFWRLVARVISDLVLVIGIHFSLNYSNQYLQIALCSPNSSLSMGSIDIYKQTNKQNYSSTRLLFRIDLITKSNKKIVNKMQSKSRLIIREKGNERSYLWHFFLLVVIFLGCDRRRSRLAGRISFGGFAVGVRRRWLQFVGSALHCRDAISQRERDSLGFRTNANVARQLAVLVFFLLDRDVNQCVLTEDRLGVEIRGQKV